MPLILTLESKSVLRRNAIREMRELAEKLRKEGKIRYKK